VLDHLHRQGQIKRSIWVIKPEQIQIGLFITNGRRRSRWADVHSRELPVAQARQPLQQGTTAAAQIEDAGFRVWCQRLHLGGHMRMQLGRGGAWLGGGHGVQVGAVIRGSHRQFNQPIQPGRGCRRSP
jgi:hypothetical protein